MYDEAVKDSFRLIENCVLVIKYILRKEGDEAKGPGSKEVIQ